MFSHTLTVSPSSMPFSIRTNIIEKIIIMASWERIPLQGLDIRNTQDASNQHLMHKELKIWSLSAASCVVDRTLSNVWFHRNWADCKSSTSHKIAMLLPAEMCFSLDSMLIICPVETHRCAHLPATAHDHGTVLSSSQTLWCSYYV